MNCPVCGDKTNVISSRRDCEGVYRLRLCTDPNCKHQFFTTEAESDRADYDRINREKNLERYHKYYKSHNKKHNKNYNKIG